MKQRATLGGWLLILVLGGAAVWGVWSLPSLKAADGRSGQSFREQTEDSLMARWEEYRLLRMEEDWPNLYSMVDVEHREEVSEANYMRAFGHGVLKTHDLRMDEVVFDAKTGSAVMRVKTDGELIPARFPPKFRANFQMPDDPSALRREGEYRLVWVWRNGEWFYRLDDEIVTGVDEQGRPITAGQ